MRITSGPFTDMEAEVVVQPGGGHKDVMVRILDCLWVPLFEVRAGEYELIELNTGGKHVYTHLDNDRLSEGLHDALGRYHASGVVVDEDARLAREVLRGYASLRGETDVIRCKLYSLLLPAYLLLGESDEFDRLRSTMRSMLPVIKAGQSRALLLVTLYGCTDSSLYQRMAHELIDPWMEEASPKKSKFVYEQLKRYEKDLKDALRIVEDDVFSRLRRQLVGRVASGGPAGIQAGTTLTSDQLHAITGYDLFEIRMESEEDQKIIDLARKVVDDKREENKELFASKSDKLNRGDELPPGVLKMVKVFIAEKDLHHPSPPSHGFRPR